MREYANIIRFLFGREDFINARAEDRDSDLR